MSSERQQQSTAARTGAEAAAAPGVESAGVEELIGRLRDTGIAKGRTEADAILNGARHQAAEIVATARREADEILAQAKTAGAKVKAATEDALRLASRDTILAMESGLIERFQTMVRWLVKDTLDDPEFLKKLILEVAGKTVPRDRSLEVLFPQALVSLEDLMKSPEQAEPGSLMGFVLSAGRGLLREGVTFGSSAEVEGGVRVKLVGEDAHVELTEGAIGQLLLEHMLPRFRALLRGAVIIQEATPPAREEPKSKATAR
jgi:V/A-type H+/Na+-transporting ATPase subunit E